MIKDRVRLMEIRGRTGVENWIVDWEQMNKYCYKMDTIKLSEKAKTIKTKVVKRTRPKKTKQE